MGHIKMRSGVLRIVLFYVLWKKNLNTNLREQIILLLYRFYFKNRTNKNFLNTYNNKTDVNQVFNKL